MHELHDIYHVFAKQPAVVDPFQLPANPADPQVAAAGSNSESAPASTPTGSSSKKSNAGIALVSQGNLLFAAFAVSAATVLVF